MIFIILDDDYITYHLAVPLSIQKTWNASRCVFGGFCGARTKLLQRRMADVVGSVAMFVRIAEVRAGLNSASINLNDVSLLR